MAKNDAKVQIKGAFKQIAKAVNDLQIDSLPEIAELVRSRIVAKARTGKTMASGEERSLPPLSESYKKDRKKRQAMGDFSLDPDFFKPSKSNVTLTGIYLDSIEVRSMDKKKGEFVVGPNDQIHGQDKFTNKKLAEFLAKQGRSIFGFDKLTLDRIKAILRRDVRTDIKKNLLKR